MLNTKGSPFAVSIPGDREHHFALPQDLGVMPVKTMKALEKLRAADREERESGARNSVNYVERKQASDKTHAALSELYDTAASQSKAARQSYGEMYEYATRRYARAIEDARQALQDVVTASLLYDQAANGCAVGMSAIGGVKPAKDAHHIYQTLESLPGISPLEGEV